ncbi:hypothetical protein [Deinococcus multiflagellatus]|uniref:TFIIB-type zinc ribbon-containing protein n=1 Tax=Deinococcus multiflagellatus TaxID=1656887 RepID=A0ABW1ZTF5_9DEIO|nr:hypothetical protein [Deinococcus multiflagellatus]MBZ9714477.1 hypothetical protein [Deinococcus multiflagellatus]
MTRCPVCQASVDAPPGRLLCPQCAASLIIGTDGAAQLRDFIDLRLELTPAVPMTSAQRHEAQLILGELRDLLAPHTQARTEHYLLHLSLRLLADLLATQMALGTEARSMLLHAAETRAHLVLPNQPDRRAAAYELARALRGGSLS